jgi:hypothetical protein
MLMTLVAALSVVTSSIADVPRSVSLTATPALTGSLLAQAEPDIIETKDGKALVGKIIDENNSGYLFTDQTGTTRLIEYGTIKSVRRGASAKPAPAPAAAPAADASSARAEIETIDADIRRLKAQRLDYPLGGPRAAAVLGAIFGLAGLANALAFTVLGAWSGAGSNAGGYIVIALLSWVVGLGGIISFIAGTYSAVKNAPKHRELTEKIQILEDKRDLILETQLRSEARRAPQAAFVSMRL